MKNIEQFIFINNEITRRGIDVLVDVLPTMERLSYFYLPLNEINGRGIMKLVSGV